MTYLTAKLVGEEREWEDGKITWVRHDTYTTKDEANKVAEELRGQGYGTEVEWINAYWKRDDPYWKGSKNYVVYKTKAATTNETEPPVTTKNPNVMEVKVEDKPRAMVDPVAFLGSMVVREKKEDDGAREKLEDNNVPRQEGQTISTPEPPEPQVHNGEEEGRRQ